MAIAEKLTTIAENVLNVYEAGRSEMLRCFTNNYIRKDYSNAFRYTDFTGAIFEKTVMPTSIYAAFQYYQGTHIPEGLDCSNVPSTADSMQWTCRYAYYLKEFPDINIGVQQRYAGTWQECKELETIEVVRCNENTIFDLAFSNNLKLKNISFEGSIGQNITFSKSPLLSRASIENVFEHLSDSSTGKTATFHSTAKANAFTDEEWTTLIATKPNWTFSLV